MPWCVTYVHTYARMCMSKCKDMYVRTYRQLLLLFFFTLFATWRSYASVHAYALARSYDRRQFIQKPSPQHAHVDRIHQNQQHAHMYDFMYVRTYGMIYVYSWTAGACGAQCAHLIINKNHIRVRICSFCNETIHLSTTPTHQTILSV